MGVRRSVFGEAQPRSNAVTKYIGWIAKDDRVMRLRNRIEYQTNLMDRRTADAPLVLHVVDTLSGGGTERQLVALLRRFDHHRLRHGIITLREAGELAEHLPREVSCRPLSARGCARGAGLRLARLARRLGARVIHARNTCTWWDATIAGFACRNARLILGFHGLDHGGAISMRQRLKARAARHVASCFTTVSQAARRQLSAEAGLPDDQIQVLPNGVDLDLFRPRGAEERGSARAALGLESSDFVVGAVGSLSAVKRFDVLIDAVSHLATIHANVRAVIIGSGPQAAFLKTRAESRAVADRVCFAGPRDDVPRCLAAFDVFVSCSDSEGFSNALLEAMATGLPIAASDIADHRPLLDNGHAGRLFERGSAAALAKTLAELAGDACERNRRGDRARVRAREFSIDQAARRYEALYAEWLTNEPGRKAASCPTVR